MTDLASRLGAVLMGSPRVRLALETCRDLGLQDWMLASGCIYQTLWNHLTGRDADHGIKDFDLFYFDPDLSWEAEDAIIAKTASRAPPPLDRLLEVRNQARVHLWFEARFNSPYPPLSSAAQALTRFLSPAFAVAVRLGASDELEIFAPFGLEDCFSMRVRPTPFAGASPNFERAARSVQDRWPEVVIVR